METLTLNRVRQLTRALAASLALAPRAFADDVSVRLDAGSGFSIQDSSGSVERLRVDERTGNVSRNGALFVHTTGRNNTFFGAGAGSPQTAGVGGNSAFGYRALHANTTGSQNSALGSYALRYNTTGRRNLALGAYAGQNQTTGSDNIYLAAGGVAKESGQIRIGTPQTHIAVFIAGIDGSNVGADSVPVFVNPDGQLGTSGAEQALWFGDTNAAGFDLNGFGNLRSSPLLGGEIGQGIQFPNETGHGFAIAGGENEQFIWAGVSRNTTASIGMNLNETGTNLGNFFNPGLATSYEHNYDAGGWPNDVMSEYHWVGMSAVGTSTVADAGTFAVNDQFLVEEPGNGQVVAVGFVKSIGSGPNAAISVDWGYTEAPDTNPPGIGDTLEGSSSTTVTNRVGSFVFNDAVWVCPVACEADGSNSTALIALISIENQTGDTADFVFLRTDGPGTAVTPGKFIRQARSGAVATLGALAVSKSTTFTSAIAGSLDSFRGMSAVFYPHLQRSNIAFHSNDATFHSGAATLRIGGGNVEDVHWLGIATTVDYDPGAGVTGMIGSPSAPQNFGMHGKWKFFPQGSVAWYNRIEVGAPSAVSGIRSQLLADASGTLPALDLSGCEVDSVIVAADAVGGLKCGPPAGGALAGASDVMTLASAPASDVAYTPTLAAITSTTTGGRSAAKSAPRANPPLLAAAAVGEIAVVTSRAGASPPPNCSPGEVFVDTDETVDANCTTTLDNALCVCAAANTWVSNQ